MGQAESSPVPSVDLTNVPRINFDAPPKYVNGLPRIPPEIGGGPVSPEDQLTTGDESYVHTPIKCEKFAKGPIPYAVFDIPPNPPGTIPRLPDGFEASIGVKVSQ